MHPRIEEVLAHLDSTRADLHAALAEVPQQQQTQRPAADRWSVAEVVEHLAIVETRLSTMLMAQLAEARAKGLGQESDTGAVVPTVDVPGLMNRSAPITASEASQPTAGLSTAAALEKLTAQRNTLRDAIVAADGLELSAVQVHHPRLGLLNLYQWFVFLGAHEARHVGQIRENVAVLAQGGTT